MPQPTFAESFGVLDPVIQPKIAAYGAACFAAGKSDQAAADVAPVQAIAAELAAEATKLQSEAAALVPPPSTVTITPPPAA